MMSTYEFRPSIDQSEKCEILIAAGFSEAEIAELFDISKAMFRKHFKDEVKAGRLKCRAEIVIGLFHAATRGNLAAARRFLALAEASAEEKNP